MAENQESEATHDYELFCTDCDFEVTVTGTVYDALDVADAHEEKHGDRSMEHFVTFKLQNVDQ